ncbi:helix-turn-helix transcriptional regulator [Hymenobacter cellulosivorans]|uniref:AraC family transcriptional regulator n=1 Tax=Hymenobacter cellulosivorans TaxID=2932249 RepID=A0ABY4F5V1_9BACT|nr:AraC family transcriptional regulator [Hymenobacter cellulosivorans]UOQ52045.1 AraC family transcriptional regulator [Hymenobacter cellulosivorans]
METFFQFRTAEFTDNAQTILQQQPGFVQAATRWQLADSHINFQDYFLDGLQMSVVRGHLQRPFQIELAVERPWLATLFQLEGQVSSKSCALRPLHIGPGQHNLMADEASANTYTFEGEQYTCFSAHLAPAFFSRLVQGNPEWLAKHEARLVNPTPFVLLPPGMAVTTAQRAIIQQIIECPYSGALKKLFLEARFLDLFIEQQTQPVLRPSGASSRDRDTLHAIRDFLDTHYAEPPSLLELARLFGTNDFKLKKGFRELFGTTVFGYIAERRLTVAWQLLTLTDQPVQEVAESVGFGNPAHFATAFRRKFGLSPSHVRRAPQAFAAGLNLTSSAALLAH